MFMNVSSKPHRLNAERLHLALIPAGDENTGSSRIRLYGMLPWLREAAVQFTLGPNPQANVLYIQKALTPELVAAVRAARGSGISIVYDIDDFGRALSYWAPPDLFDEMILLAHVVTTDTSGRQLLLKAKHPEADVKILPPLVDYSPSSPQPLANLSDNEIRVLWFGSMSNISLFNRYANDLAACANVKVVVITGETYLSAAERFPNVEFIPWNRASFASALRSCHLSCLMHDGDEADRSKNNNRMITSITWGVPAVVSDTPEYSRTAGICGIPEAIFSGPEDLESTIRALSSKQARQAYLDKAQPVIWNNHAPEIITGQFIKLMRRLVAEPN